MGFDGLGSGVKIRKLMAISIRTCYRSVCNHPFLVGMVCFLIFLYRLSPFVFSLLVSASPILVCTAILLGTLLSFGQPNVPEIEKEEKATHEVSSLKIGVVENATVVERDESFVVERHVAKGTGIVEKEVEAANLVNNEINEVEEDAGTVRYMPLIDENSSVLQCEKRVIDEVERESDDSVLEKKRGIRERPGGEGLLSLREVEDQCPLIDKVGDENLQVDADNFPAESSVVHKGDELDSSLLTAWKHVGHDEEENDDGGSGGGGCDDDDDDGSLDSESDGAESSSPDASMADIMPMLDELHPLLDSRTLLLARLSNDESDPDGSVDLDEDIEIQGEEDHDDEEEEEEEEGEVEKGDEEDGSKSAIKWTEDDQKNLMDLGTSELERNQRLENLIARRRARKSMKLMAEKNLIDLDGADLPFNNITPISVTRRNPFDLPYDPHDNLGLPPIPGSAPSILQPRKNPFDLPYDSGEEKPDLKDDSFQQEFSTFHQREAFFRRHESFNVGPSSLGGPRQDVKWKPYFVPEQLATEGTGSHLFQRQLSEVSESKMSSIPDSESVCSVVEEDKNLNELTASQEAQLISNVDHACIPDEGSQSSGDVNSLDIEKAEKRDAHHDVVETVLGDEESQKEIESSVSDTGGTPTCMDFDANEIPSRIEAVEDDYSSRSSLSSLTEIVEKISDAKGEESTSSEPRGHHSKESDISPRPSLEGSEFHFISGAADDNQHKEPVYDSSPHATKNLLSFSSVSSDTQAEISEMGLPSVLVESGDQELVAHSENIEQINSSFEELHEASQEETSESESRVSDLSGITEHDVVSQVGPSQVSSSSVNLDGSLVSESVVEHVLGDSESFSLENVLVEEGIADKVEDFHQEHNQGYSLRPNVGVLLESNQCMAEELDSAPKEQQPIHPCISSEAEPVKVQETELELGEIHSSSMSGDGTVEEGIIEPVKEGIIEPVKVQETQLELGEIHSSSMSDDGTVEEGILEPVKVQETQLELGEIHSSSMSDGGSVEEGIMTHKEDSVQIEPDQIRSSSSDADIQVDANHEKEAVFQMDQVELSSSDSKMDADLHHDMDVKVVPSDSSHQAGPSEENCLAWSDKSIGELSFSVHDEHQEPFPLVVESKEEVKIVDNVNEVNDFEDQISENSSPSHSISIPGPSESPKGTDKEELKGSIPDEIAYEDHKEVSGHLDYPTEVYGSDVTDGNVNEEEDVIKEIDEGILSELDAVGDFNVKEVFPEETIIEDTEFALSPNDMKKENTLELPVLEARSVEDIDMAFKQLHEGVDVEEVILPSMIEEFKDFADSKSQLPVLEARSLEDIHVALQQVSEFSLSKMLNPFESKDDSIKVETRDLVSTKEVESSNVESNIQENIWSHDVSSAKGIESGDQECGSHDVVPSQEIESRSEESSAQGSRKNAEIESGVGEDGNHAVVPTKEIESSSGESRVQVSSKNTEIESGDYEGGSHHVVLMKDIKSTSEESSVQLCSGNAADELKHRHAEASEE
ncbi:hypothetical protein SLEP1_g54165 [Rubroshorea leprosula]|uniref:Uncharacterized protein n=1 Tax=Rubroshorea leprosula TaxID=152421 RepID=A0AAV5MCL9_9ROSI|nr:hypothetical protein SLEP1_g54165 [Rubroshorea leprosula]